MTWLNIWDPIYINRSNRPILLDNEYIEYIRDNIGLYQGKSKIVNRQNGRIYLTNKRLIYFDNKNQQLSLSLDLTWINSIELIDGFLTSLPKIKLYLNQSRELVPAAIATFTWVCKICSFKNKYDDSDDDLKCQSCGIKPSKSIIDEINQKRKNATNNILDSNIPSSVDNSLNQCSTCTFINHPSMKTCEICGNNLQNSNSNKSSSPTHPLPNIVLENNQEVYSSDIPYIKLSFRKGGETKFHQFLTKILDTIKWDNLQKFGKINQNAIKLNQQDQLTNKKSLPGGGIRNLEILSENQRKLNEHILSNSLNDLENLMFKYKDLIKLTENFMNSNKITQKSIPPLNISKKSSLYLSELARHISEYTLNLFTSSSSMITSQDLFAEYNRYLINCQGFGIELITSQEFLLAINLFSSLNLPIVLKKYENSGLLVLTHSNVNSYQTYILNFLNQNYNQYIYNKFKREMTENSESFDYFRGNTISEISDHFNWAYNITIEEIEKCVSNGSIIIDHHISGTFYFLNIFNSENYHVDENEIKQKVENDLRSEIEKGIELESSVDQDILRETTNQSGSKLSDETRDIDTENGASIVEDIYVEPKHEGAQDPEHNVTSLVEQPIEPKSNPCDQTEVSLLEQRLHYGISLDQVTLNETAFPDTQTKEAFNEDTSDERNQNAARYQTNPQAY